MANHMAFMLAYLRTIQEYLLRGRGNNGSTAILETLFSSIAGRRSGFSLGTDNLMIYELTDYWQDHPAYLILRFTSGW